MRAYWMGPSEVECDAGALLAEGILTERFDPTAASSVATEQRAKRNWEGEEQLQLSATAATPEALIAKEADEHTHLGDEVRLFVDGGGLYDVRARDDRWLRVWVSAGDLIVIPAKRYHRFLLGQHGASLVQIFESRSHLVPLFRASSDETRAV
jgi:1,2-dihydroxy-3-keto-5-methylthiopentene dioxygenase